MLVGILPQEYLDFASKYAPNGVPEFATPLFQALGQLAVNAECKLENQYCPVEILRNITRVLRTAHPEWHDGGTGADFEETIRLVIDRLCFEEAPIVQCKFHERGNTKPRDLDIDLCIFRRVFRVIGTTVAICPICETVAEPRFRIDDDDCEPLDAPTLSEAFATSSGYEAIRKVKIDADQSDSRSSVCTEDFWAFPAVTLEVFPGGHVRSEWVRYDIRQRAPFGRTGGPESPFSPRRATHSMSASKEPLDSA